MFVLPINQQHCWLVCAPCHISHSDLPPSGECHAKKLPSHHGFSSRAFRLRYPFAGSSRPSVWHAASARLAPGRRWDARGSRLPGTQSHDTRGVRFYGRGVYRATVRQGGFRERAFDRRCKALLGWVPWGWSSGGQHASSAGRIDPDACEQRSGALRVRAAPEAWRTGRRAGSASIPSDDLIVAGGEWVTPHPRLRVASYCRPPPASRALPAGSPSIP
jgi:hypothetical protein